MHGRYHSGHFSDYEVITAHPLVCLIPTMKLFAFALIANAEKCSEPCGVGSLSDGTVCNIEPCSYYDELNLFQNGRMDNSTDTSWNANGATVTHQTESYNNGGYLISGRTATWRGIKQDFTSEQVISMRNRKRSYKRLTQ